MELTMEEAVAEPPAEAGPIQFVWEDGNGRRTALISTTTSTTTSPTERFIARQKIEEHRRKPPHQHRIVPPLNPNAPPTPPRREPSIVLVPLDGGLVIRKRAATTADQQPAVGQPVCRKSAGRAGHRARRHRRDDPSRHHQGPVTGRSIGTPPNSARIQPLTGF